LWLGRSRRCHRWCHSAKGRRQLKGWRRRWRRRRSTAKRREWRPEE
jgi:hypothetical protein